MSIVRVLAGIVAGGVGLVMAFHGDINLDVYQELGIIGTALAVEVFPYPLP